MKFSSYLTSFLKIAMLLYVDEWPVVSGVLFLFFCCDVANLEYSFKYLSDAGSVIRVIPDFVKKMPRSTGLRIVIVSYAKNL